MLNDTSMNSREKILQAKHMEHWQIVAGGVAHDFNNLLTSILGQSSLALLQLPEEAVARSHIERVIKAAEYATALTDQLLTYSQGNQAKVEAIDLNLLLKDSLNLLDKTFLNGVTLDVHMAPQLSVFPGKRGQIQQVIMNLLINAAEAIHPHKGTITIRTGQQKRNGRNETGSVGNNGFHSAKNYIFLQIQDNGAGIDPVTLNHIFEPYFTTKPNGRGLGLAAVNEIVLQYQGYLDVHSEVGQGTIITVYLPTSKNLTPPGPLIQ